MEITEEIKKILFYLSDETSYRYGFLEKETSISRKRLKEIMFRLKIAGYVYWGQTYDEDIGFCGSGHFLTGEGINLKEKLGIKTYYEPFWD
ncbi:MAG: hypothetical protein WC619_01955 [Patescibacteria group bacterium]